MSSRAASGVKMVRMGRARKKNTALMPMVKTLSIPTDTHRPFFTRWYCPAP